MAPNFILERLMRRPAKTIWRGEGHPSKYFGGATDLYRYPAMRSYFYTPRGVQVRNRWSASMLHQLRDIQIDNVAAQKLFTIAQGLFNPDGNKETYGTAGAQIPLYGPWSEDPISQGVASDGQPVMVIDVDQNSGWIRIETFSMWNWDFDTRPYWSHPWLYTDPILSVQVGTGDPGNAIDSRGVRWPLLSRTESWLPPGSVEYIDNFDEFIKEDPNMADPKDNYAKGKDFSHHTQSHDPTVQPLDFDILKLGLGTWMDPRAQKGGDLYESIQTSPIRGGYWYYSSNSSWKKQCDDLMRAAGDYYHFIAWDYERGGNTLNGQTADFCQMSMEYLRAYSGKKVLLYSSTIGFNEKLYPYDSSTRPWYADEDLWIAQWPSKSWYDKETKIAPTMPKGVDSWKIWQYGGDQWTWYGIYGYKEGAAYGLGKDSVDLNHFNGDPAMMKAWAGVDDVPLVEPPPSTDPTFNDGYLSALSDVHAEVDTLADNL